MNIGITYDIYIYYIYVIECRFRNQILRHDTLRKTMAIETSC